MHGPAHAHARPHPPVTTHCVHPEHLAVTTRQPSTHTTAAHLGPLNNSLHAQHGASKVALKTPTNAAALPHSAQGTGSWQSNMSTAHSSPRGVAMALWRLTCQVAHACTHTLKVGAVAFSLALPRHCPHDHTHAAPNGGKTSVHAHMFSRHTHTRTHTTAVLERDGGCRQPLGPLSTRTHASGTGSSIPHECCWVG
jgi:hypothetical protein